MKRRQPGRDAPEEVAESLGEQLGQEFSSRTVMLHEAVAESLGLHSTDHKCLEHILREGGGEPVSARELADFTGLTSGAVTAIIHRLERAGYVQREPHPTDRRQVLVRPVLERAREIQEQFEPFREAWTKLCNSYSPRELALIQDFMARSIELLRHEALRIRAQRPRRQTPAKKGPRR
jgi:DNA-binding MarR family transcriptional regulator